MKVSLTLYPGDRETLLRGCRSVTKNEYAWKVTVKEIEDRNYNLDFKNPHVVDIEHGDPEVLMKEYEEISKQLIATRDMLKKELLQALGSGK